MKAYLSWWQARHQLDNPPFPLDLGKAEMSFSKSHFVHLFIWTISQDKYTHILSCEIMDSHLEYLISSIVPGHDNVTAIRRDRQTGGRINECN